MATGSKRGRKPSSTSNRNKKQPSKKNQNTELNAEIVLFVALGVSILLLLGTCGLLGSFGKAVRGVLIGLFGMVGFVVPFAFFFCCMISFSSKWKKVIQVKIISIVSILFVLASFAQLIFARDTYVTKITDYYTDKVKNGGFIGGALTHFLCKFLGLAGTIVVLIVVLIICIVLLTDRSIISGVKESSKYIKEDYERNSVYRRERNAAIIEERREREIERSIKRREKYDERVRKQEEKRAASIEETRRRTAQKHSRNIERMNFEASNLKAEQKPDFEEINDAAFGDEYDIPASTEELQKKNEPESIFYGSATDYYSTVEAIKEATAADVSKIMEESASGLLSATKLSKEPAHGDMREITENYCADDEFFDYVNNISGSHKITVNNSDSYEDDNRAMQDAYERDVVVKESDIDDYDDVANIFGRRDNSSHRIKVGLDTESLVEANDYLLEKEQQRSLKEDNYTANNSINSSLINQNSNYNSFDDDDEQDNDFSFEDPDIKQESEKPKPVSNVSSVGKSVKPKRSLKYKLPPVTLLDEVNHRAASDDGSSELNEMARQLKDTLKTFGLDVSILGASRGPAVTRFEIQMPAGVSVKKITGLENDIMMSLEAKDVRIEAPIPGKKAVGIEIPNRKSTMVHFRELVESKAFKNFDSNVTFGVGKDLSGEIVVTDISKMPHLLIAGATGSGKSVCINTLIMSILFKAKPDEVKLIMIDPKMVELSIYNGIPHLLIPVVTDPKKASAALNWAVNEMTIRYQKFAELGVRNMKGYNSKIQSDPTYHGSDQYEYMPQIVIVVDELADLMMVASKEVEAAIVRLTQLARAAGIYLIVATQRPSVDVITGLIKANIPSRIAFSVSSGVDSRTILDMYGAERLLGNGDMLFLPRDYNKPARVQGAFVSDEEVERVVDFVKGQSSGDSYDENAMSIVNAGGAASAGGSPGLVDPNDAYDDLFTVAGHAVIESGKASIGMLQRKFKIGFNRAARIMDQLSDEGVVGPEEGTKPRKILMSIEQFNQMLEEKNHS